jgi:uncharacterized protein (TIGR03546 family)
MLTRKLGKLIRGKVTPAQIAMACILGAMLGFVPSLRTSPGLVLTLTLLLIVLNANLLVAGFVGGLAKLLSLLIMPIQFEAGRLILDGPLSGLMRSIINAPVLAWFGFEHYATTGGVLLGFIAGLLAAAALVTAITNLRRRLAKLEAGSERYQKITGRKWAKGLIWIFFGGQKKSYEELAAKRIGLPIRPMGVIAAILVIGLVWVGAMFFSEPLVTAALTSGLQRANGATVDVGSASVDFSESRLLVTSLAMADPEALDTDLFRASRLEGKLSNADLLRKRLAIDLLVAADASTGAQRKTPGVLVGPRKKPPPPKRPGEGKTIEEYLAEAEKWKDRLQQARRWLDEISRKKEEDAPTDPSAPPPDKRETLRERLEREIAEKGYPRVTAAHLVEGAPTLLVRETRVEGMTAAQAPGEIFDITALNVSTQPWLVEDAPHLTVRSRSGAYEADIALASVSAPGGAGGETSTLTLARRGIPGDTVSQALAAAGGEAGQVLSGGTVDAIIQGAFRPEWIDLPLNVTIHDSTITIPGAGSAPVEQLHLPIGVIGPLDAPHITIDPDAWSKALTDAGATALANKVRGEVQEEVDKATEKAREEADKRIREGLGGLIPGRRERDGGG